MSGKAARWQEDAQRARSDLVRLAKELEQWEAAQQSASTPAQRGERARRGAAIRGKVSTLKLEFDRLKRELDGLSDKSHEHEVTRKTITQYRDELNQALAELAELQRRSRGATASAGPAAASGTASGAASGAVSGAAGGPPAPAAPHGPAGTNGGAPGPPSGPFTRLAVEPCGSNGSSLPATMQQRPNSAGAELQPVSQRSMLQQQQQMMRDFDEPLNALEGTVDNMRQVSHLIRDEITVQNRMLDQTNELTDQVGARLGRVRAMLDRWSSNDRRQRCLLVSVLLLLAGLIITFVLVVTS